MGKSARVLGKDYGLTAQEMNHVLKEDGYLEGDPGNYSVTEKGKKYVSEQYHSRGTGGSSIYNASWETRTWDEGITDELDITEDRKREIRQGMKEAKQKKNEPENEFFEVDYDNYSYEGTDTTDEKSNGFYTSLGFIILGVSMYGISKAIPYGKSFMNDRVKPLFNEKKNKVAAKGGKNRKRK